MRTAVWTARRSFSRTNRGGPIATRWSHDAQEVYARHRPASSDTDGDGFSDGAECVGPNPTVVSSRPASILRESRGRHRRILYRPRSCNGLVGPLGRPNGGLGFGSPYDQARLYVAAFDRLLVADPLRHQPDGSLAVTEVGAFGAPSASRSMPCRWRSTCRRHALRGRTRAEPEFRQTDQYVMIHRQRCRPTCRSDRHASSTLCLRPGRGALCFAARMLPEANRF